MHVELNTSTSTDWAAITCWLWVRHSPEEDRKDLHPYGAYSLKSEDKQLSKGHRVLTESQGSPWPKLEAQKWYPLLMSIIMMNIGTTKLMPIKPLGGTISLREYCF